MMRRLSLRPYHGHIRLCETPEEYREQLQKITGDGDTFIDPAGGRYHKLVFKKGRITYLVYAYDHNALAHELVHVLLHAFEVIGAHPEEGTGEPFCYMLSQLLKEAQR